MSHRPSDSGPLSMARPCVVAAISLLSLVACTQPRVLVLCHNANCAGSTDPNRDDTVQALRASLAQRFEGRPAVDGVEMDLFWNGHADDGKGRCQLAHEQREHASDASEAAREIAAHLARESVSSWNGDWFILQMELKGFVGAYSEKHDPQQAVQHVECALDVMDVVETAATLAHKRIEIVIDSAQPGLLLTLAGRERWRTRTNTDAIRLRTAADFIDSTSSNLSAQHLDDFPAVTDVVFHAGWIDDAHYQAFRTLGLDLTLWMFSATGETFATLRKLEPRAVITSEAMLMRRWLDR